MSDTEAACLLSVAGVGLAAGAGEAQERLWTLGCLAIGAADLAYYLPGESQEDLAARLFARLAGRPEADVAGSQALKGALEEMDDLPSTEVRAKPVAQMLRLGIQLGTQGGGVAATRLARLLWNGLRMDTAYKPRASLLHLLFRLGQIGVIESLADTARPHQQLVVNCVKVFAHAESNPDVYDGDGHDVEDAALSCVIGVGKLVVAIESLAGTLNLGVDLAAIGAFKVNAIFAAGGDCCVNRGAGRIQVPRDAVLLRQRREGESKGAKILVIDRRIADTFRRGLEVLPCAFRN